MPKEVDFSKGVRGKYHGRTRIVGPVSPPRKDLMPNIKAKYIPCDCGGRAIRSQASTSFRIGNKSVTVDNIPAFVCPECGEPFFDGPSLVRIEKQLKREAAV